MKYCGLTMKRQLELKSYDLKEWCVNALSLSDAYLAREHFAQAEYLMFAAFNLIPDKSDKDETKELKAQVQTSIGRYFRKRLEIGVVLYASGSEYI